MPSQAVPRPFSLEEYLALEEESEFKSEYRQGRIVV